MDSLDALSDCLRFTADLVDATRTGCEALTSPSKTLTEIEFLNVAASINGSRSRLEAAHAAVDADESDVWDSFDAANIPYQPFLWDGHPYNPATLAVPVVAASLLMDTTVFESWAIHALSDAERIRDCARLLAKWPIDLPTRLRMLRGQVDHERTALRRADGPSPGYLGLIVDSVRGEVRREGFNHDAPVMLGSDTANWFTFITAYNGGTEGGSKLEFKKASGAEFHRRNREKLNAKIEVLDVRLASLTTTCGQLLLETVP